MRGEASANTRPCWQTCLVPYWHLFLWKVPIVCKVRLAPTYLSNYLTMFPPPRSPHFAMTARCGRQVGDRADSVYLPTCQTGCSWPSEGSGGGVCSSNVTVCDETTIQWLATQFADPVPPRAEDLCKCIPGDGADTQNPPAAAPCGARVSVFHCHVLPHEDEGCMAVVRWTCPGTVNPPGRAPQGTQSARRPDKEDAKYSTIPLFQRPSF